MSEGNLDSATAKRALFEAASAVFGEMAFMDANPIETEHKMEMDTIRVAIDMLKPLSYRLELEYSSSLAVKIADTLYGEAEVALDEDENMPSALADRSRDDSSLEMLNVMAGTFLSSCFGAGTPFKLELPFFQFGEADVSGPVIARVDLDVEGLPASLILRSIRYRY
ncbi:hypothetical protein MASR2M78_27380 [Treponema sp.]